MPTSTSKSRKSVIRPVTLKSESSDLELVSSPQTSQSNVVSESLAVEPAKTRKKTTATAAKSKTQVIPPIELKVSHESIAFRAWEIWQSQGCPVGRDLENWLQAEKELTSAS